MRYGYSLLIAVLFLFVTAGCQLLKDHDTPSPVSTVATDLISSLGLEADAQGHLWVTEAGSGTANDGQLTLITPDGTVFPVVQGFTS
ncbi:hypothetical protein ACFQ4C_21410 [Larkinella insperata]|uniref:Uncharacterized protein n=1 Tax=Larkinella insperata TaxID=332158 RepID=A0ABW3QKU2_9BACT